MIRLLAVLIALLLVSFTLCTAASNSAKGECGECVENNKKLTLEGCAQLGFNRETLKCPTCDVVQRVVGDDSLSEECRSCCTAEVNDSVYHKAVLEVDRRFVESFPDVQKIIKAVEARKKKKKGDFLLPPKLDLSVKFTFAAKPTLHVYKKGENSPADSISCMTWSSDVFKDFFASSFVVDAEQEAVVKEEL